MNDIYPITNYRPLNPNISHHSFQSVVVYQNQAAKDEALRKVQEKKENILPIFLLLVCSLPVVGTLCFSRFMSKGFGWDIPEIKQTYQKLVSQTKQKLNLPSQQTNQEQGLFHLKPEHKPQIKTPAKV